MLRFSNWELAAPMADADFLRLILAEPEADGPRLVFADWLEEHGDVDRAEFIRLQCARAKLPIGDARFLPLLEREKVLLEQHRLAWSASLSGLATSWDFVRGFPDHVRVDAATFLNRSDELFAAAPVRHMELQDVFNQLPKIAKSPNLARLAGLKITASRLGDAIPKALAHSPHLSRLTQLNLSRNRIGDDGTHALASTQGLANLYSLDLSENEIGPTGAAILAAAPHLVNLAVLKLRDNAIGAKGVAALLTSTRLEKLRKLDLAYSHVGLAALDTLPNSEQGPYLAELDLAGNEIGDLGVHQLVNWPKINAVRQLDLSRNELGDPAAITLAEAPALSRLHRIALNGNRITDIGKQVLMTSTHLKHVAKDLRENSQLAAFRR